MCVSVCAWTGTLCNLYLNETDYIHHAPNINRKPTIVLIHDVCACILCTHTRTHGVYTTAFYHTKAPYYYIACNFHRAHPTWNLLYFYLCLFVQSANTNNKHAFVLKKNLACRSIRMTSSLHHDEDYHFILQVVSAT